jgi:hypothetical protein
VFAKVHTVAGTEVDTKFTDSLAHGCVSVGKAA